MHLLLCCPQNTIDCSFRSVSVAVLGMESVSMVVVKLHCLLLLQRTPQHSRVETNSADNLSMAVFAVILVMKITSKLRKDTWAVNGSASQ